MNTARTALAYAALIAIYLAVIYTAVQGAGAALIFIVLLPTAVLFAVAVYQLFHN
jgi:hypothetical protein